MADIIIHRNRIDRLLADYRAATSAVRAETATRDRAAADSTLAVAGRDLIQQSAAAVQQAAHAKIAAVVSRCLSGVFDDPYQFVIQFDRKRGRTEASLHFVRDGLVLDDPLNQAGGGVVDIAAFALRLACLVLQRPPLRRLLVLDEPFKNLRGSVYRARVRTMLESLSQELGVQFVLCVDHTAYPEFTLGLVVEQD